MYIAGGGFSFDTLNIRRETQVSGHPTCADFNPFSDALVTAGQFHLTFWEVRSRFRVPHSVWAHRCGEPMRFPARMLTTLYHAPEMST